jgi:hypothetical protein
MFEINPEIFVAILTLAITLFSFFLAIRAELRKNHSDIQSRILADEKRHSSHEQRCALMEERISFIEDTVSSRLENINYKISDLGKVFIDHIEKRHT